MTSAKQASDLAAALGSAAGWRQLADRETTGRKVAQEFNRQLQSVIRDARAVLADQELTPEEKASRARAILGRPTPVIKVREKGTR